MKRLFLPFLLAILTLAPSALHAEPEQPTTEPTAEPPAGEPVHSHGKAAEHEAAVHTAPQTCAEVLAEPEPDPHEQHPLTEAVFHHLADSYSVSSELPYYDLNLKKVLCQTTGWNGIVHLGSFTVDLTPTKHLFFMWVSALLLIVAGIAGAPKKGQLVPHGFKSGMEMLVLFIRDELARKNIPGRAAADRFTPFLATCFFLILIMGLVGLVPWGATASSNIAVTLGFALLTFIMTQYAGIRAAGLGGYLKHLTGGVHPLLWPIMIPVEVLGLFTKPFALTVRLFANMVAGHVVIMYLIGLIFILSVFVAPVSVIFAFGIYLLELFVAFVQAYVFTILSALFIGTGVGMGHHSDGHASH